MKLLLTIFLFCLFFTANSQSKYHYINPDSLSWKNFTGKPNYQTTFIAYTCSKFNFSYKRVNGSLQNIKVWAMFNYDSSYIKKEYLSFKTAEENNYLFIHEKNHYLISIIYAKRFKKFISENPKMTDNAIINLYNNNFVTLSQAEENYDRETNHSMDKEKQRIWNMQILSLLNDLKNITLEEDK